MSNFSEDIINSVWEKAEIVNEGSKNEWRQDYAGAWINKNQYGEESDYGWEIDHANPVSNGGGDELANLMPLNWRNNRTKSDDYPSFKTSVTSDGNKNIEKEKNWKYN
ncbi:HNH endonuclease signature motif containing protein [Pseudofulvibacter geojedonensis]|uniref:HNH endonuclease signature motif containing protein n=1 Tax=Pseudofulvibacter geojedonensis TaxID=1123758 RepID=A0ABW3I078_9FLAO